ncbi:DUF4190 domain-containing protein [Actinoplanes sp. NPDC049118]|uniref:DUF4190 domain-containing protein n=1 Tax=Actinoplanes sp. NPDC049118 TaxID=3155769 RepID=UPI0033E80924
MTYPPHQPYDPDQAYQVPVVPSAPPISPGPYGQPYPQQQPIYHQVVPAAAPPPSGWSIASLIFGVLGMLGGFCLFGIPCLAAVICGHAGLRETNGGVRSGRGMAIAGLIMGYIFVAPAIAVIVMGGVGSVLPASSTSP